MTPQEIVGTSVAELTRGYADGRWSPPEVLRGVLDHVANINPQLNALFSIREGEAFAQATASLQRWREGEPLGPLDGVPVTIKDSVAKKGWPYFHGIAANRDAPVSNFDAPPAARLDEAGAVTFAKTTMPDCGLLAAGVSSMFGIIRNPWNSSVNTGGSSAGAGSSLAAGMGFLSVGSDIAGSVRLPAAHCGLAALKPSQGRIPHLMPDTMRSAGPMGRTVADIAAMLSVLARPDLRDPWSLPLSEVAYERRLNHPSTGLRIGLLTDMGFGQSPDPVVVDMVLAAGRALETDGANVEQFRSPFCNDCYAPIDRWLQIRGLAEYSRLPPHSPEAFNAEIRAWCHKSADLKAQDALEALNEIGRIRATMLMAFESYDYLLSPVLPVVSFPAEAVGLDTLIPLAHTTFTALFNQTGQPAAAICFGFSPDGLPVGVQVVGKRFDDLGVLQIGHRLENLRGKAIDWPIAPRGLY